MLKNYQLAPKFFHSLHICVPDSHNEAFTIHGWLSASTYVHQRREGLRIFCVEECRYIFLNQQIITNAYFFSGLPDDATAVSHFVHQANVARPRGHVLVPAGRHNEQWAQNSHWLHLWVNRDEIILISLCRILARLVCVARQDIFGGGGHKICPLACEGWATPVYVIYLKRLSLTRRVSTARASAARSTWASLWGSAGTQVCH